MSLVSLVTYTEGIPEFLRFRIHSVYVKEASHFCPHHDHDPDHHTSALIIVFRVFKLSSVSNENSPCHKRHQVLISNVQTV